MNAIFQIIGKNKNKNKQNFSLKLLPLNTSP